VLKSAKRRLGGLSPGNPSVRFLCLSRAAFVSISKRCSLVGMAAGRLN
jgi:hypothetical protein